MKTPFAQLTIKKSIYTILYTVQVSTRFSCYKNIVYKNIKAEIWFNIFGVLKKYLSWNIFDYMRKESLRPEMQFKGALEGS